MQAYGITNHTITRLGISPLAAQAHNFGTVSIIMTENLLVYIFMLDSEIVLFSVLLYTGADPPLPPSFPPSLSLSLSLSLHQSNVFTVLATLTHSVLLVKIQSLLCCFRLRGGSKRGCGASQTRQFQHVWRSAERKD